MYKIEVITKAGVILAPSAMKELETGVIKKFKQFEDDLIAEDGIITVDYTSNERFELLVSNVSPELEAKISPLLKAR